MLSAYGDWLVYAAWKLHNRLQRFAYGRLCDRLEEVCRDEQRLQKVLAVSAPEHHKRWLRNWAKTLRELD